jgi:4-amino-4-deoxy-L-arabinose transferase-like glycosyltransferase
LMFSFNDPPSAAKWRQWVAPVFLLALCGFLYFFRLGQLPLKDFDEGYYAGGAGEMLARHNFLTPYLNGQPMFAKPIFVYWLIAASYRVFGFGEFAARFWSALSAVGVVLLVYAFGKRFVNPRAGFLAAVMLAANYQWMDMGRDASVDMVLTLLLTSSLMLLFTALNRPAGTRGWFVLAAYPLLGLAGLAKGPLPLVICGAGVLAYIVATRQTRGAAARLHLGLGLSMLLLVAAPWYVAEGLRHPGFLTTFFISEHLGHLVGHCARVTPPWGHLQNTFVFFFPWSAFLIPSFAGMAGKWRRSGPLTFSAYTSIAIIGLLSVGHAKLAHYIMPAFPFLALMAGSWADDWLRRKERERVSVRVSFGVLTLVGVLIFVGLIMLMTGHWRGVVYFWRVRWGVGVWPQWILAGLAACCIGAALLARARRRRASLLVLMVMAIATNGLVAFVIRPKVALVEEQPRKELAIFAAQRVGPCGLLAIYHTKWAGTIAYSRRVVTNLNLSSPEAVADLLRDTPGSAVITKSEFLPELASHGICTVWARRRDFCVVSDGGPLVRTRR